MGLLPWPGTAPLSDESQSCSLVILSSEPALEEPFTASEGG
jgi:hypothetical protein